MNRISVVVVDDHAVVRDGLRALLTTRADIDVVGVAADGVEALEVAALSGRERQVLDMVAAGLGNQSIGRRLDISPKTVANIISTVLVKLGVPDRLHAAEIARHAGLGRQQFDPPR